MVLYLHVGTTQNGREKQLSLTWSPGNGCMWRAQ